MKLEEALDIQSNSSRFDLSNRSHSQSVKYTGTYLSSKKNEKREISCEFELTKANSLKVQRIKEMKRIEENERVQGENDRDKGDD